MKSFYRMLLEQHIAEGDCKISLESEIILLSNAKT